jgi:hypothetical protein
MSVSEPSSSHHNFYWCLLHSLNIATDLLISKYRRFVSDGNERILACIYLIRDETSGAVERRDYFGMTNLILYER